MRFVVDWSNGRRDVVDTIEEARREVLAKYPDAAIGHSGDLGDGGDRTLCWPDEASAENDAGERAIAEILVEVKS